MDDSSVVKASALVAFALTVNTLRFLQQRGALKQADVTLIVGETLGALEHNDMVTDPDAQAARALLSSIAQQLGVPLAKPN